MRALAGLFAIALGGCAQLIGATDPVPAAPVPDAINGDYLLAVSVQGAITDTLQWDVSLNVEDAQARVVGIGFTPLDHTTRDQLPSSSSEEIFLDNAATLDFEIAPFQEVAPAAATAGSAEIDFDATFDGHFPMIGEMVTSDAFCGTITGGITAPTEGQITNTTFAAVKIEGGTLPPPPPKVSCADLGGI